jgi:OOP family OmpA-OmpF porin
MAGDRQTLWAGAATAGATIAAVAVCGAVLWNLGAAQRAQFVAELSALNAKIDKTHAAVAEIQGSSTLADTGKALVALNADVQKTNARLAELQQNPSLDGIKGTLAQLDGKIGTSDKTVARLDAAINELKSAIASTTAAQAAALQKIAARIDSVGSAAEIANKQIADQMSQNKQPVKPADKDAAGEMMVVYVSTPPASAADTTGTVPGKPPLSVRFEKIGSTDASSQTRAIVADLKKIINGRRDCAISVAGFADTLGSDAVNLDVSRGRAEAVAAGLTAAFASEGVEVKKVAWGERQLKVWTPDNKSEKANRRVDISVECRQ